MRRIAVALTVSIVVFAGAGRPVAQSSDRLPYQIQACQQNSAPRTWSHA